MDPLSLRLLPGHYAIARPNSWPTWLPTAGFVSVTRTAHEFSIVCEQHHIPEGVQAEPGWSLLELQGPFPFHLTGILDSILHPLAQAKIPIFALSTHDTDYVLVKTKDLPQTLATLTHQGHTIL